MRVRLPDLQWKTMALAPSPTLPSQSLDSG
jgi:hypothetical protein